MHRTAAALLATVGLALSATLAAPAAEEGTIQLAFVHPMVMPQTSASQAQQLFSDVNATRARLGLAQLVEDRQLDAIAMQVAQQMATRHYFGHTDPNGVTFEQRMQASGYRYTYAAENMAFDQDEAHANAAFIHSPGHYANMIASEPHKMGTAVVAAGDGEIFYVEEFAAN